MACTSDRFFSAVERRGGVLVPAGWRREPDEHYLEGGNCPRCGREGASADPHHKPDRVRLFPADASRTGREHGHWYCKHCGGNGDGVSFIMEAFRVPKSDWPAVYEEVTGQKPPDRKGWRQGGRAPAPRQRPAPASPPKVESRQRPDCQTPASASFPSPRTPLPLTPASTRKTEAAKWTVRPNPYPNESWRDCAGLLAWRLHPRLFLPERPADWDEARRNITEGRGLELDFAAECGIFWNRAPIDLNCEDCQAWGLSRRWVGIPRGIVILLLRHQLNDMPWCGGEVVGMQVRLAEPMQDGTRLLWLPWRNEGDTSAPGIRSLALGKRGLPVVVTESALDAALCLQEAGGWNRVAVVSPCGAPYPLDEDATEYLRSAPALYGWPDADKPGEDAFEKWKAAFPNMRKISMPVGLDGRPIAKDPTDLARLSRTRPGTPTVRQILEEALNA